MSMKLGINEVQKDAHAFCLLLYRVPNHKRYKMEEYNCGKKVTSKVILNYT